MTTYPNVPVAPGVPPVPRDPNAGPQPTIPPGTDNTTVVNVSLRLNQWGIFDKNGASAIVVDSFVRVGWSKEWSTPDYPIEDGSFETYNKVELPFEGAIALTRSGTESDRRSFLNTIEDICSSIDPFTLVTPEKSYPSVTFIKPSYDRSVDSGATMITVQLAYRQIRNTAVAQFTNTAAPQGAVLVDGGNVQAQQPDLTELNAFGPNAGVG